MRVTYNDDWISDVEVSVTLSRPERYCGGKTVLFIDGQPSPEDLYPEEWTKETLQRLWDESDVKGSKLWKAYNKCEREIARTAYDIGAPMINDEIRSIIEAQNDAIANRKYVMHRIYTDGFIKDEYKFVFDRKAGCGCGCSPGWRIKTSDYKTVHLGATRDTDVWLRISLQTSKQRERLKYKQAESKIRSIESSIEATQKRIEEYRNKYQKELDNIVNLKSDLIGARRAFEKMEDPSKVDVPVNV